MKKKILLFFLTLLLLGCFKTSWEFKNDSYGFDIDFPCDYKEIERNTFQCGDPKTHGYKVTLIEKTGMDNVKQKELFESFLRFPDEKFKRAVKEKEVNGFKVVEYAEEEYILLNNNEKKLRKISKYSDMFKDNFEIEISAWFAQSPKTTDKEFENLKLQFESFFNSMKLK